MFASLSHHAYCEIVTVGVEWGHSRVQRLVTVSTQKNQTAPALDDLCERTVGVPEV